jgi:uncharacterized protein YdeI (YjbR/CyaY-like superfamily)
MGQTGDGLRPIAAAQVERISVPATKELPVLSFASGPKWETWLSKHHADTDGVWIQMARKASGIASVAHDEALDVALCYGWIDGQRRGKEGTYFLQKFTPRRRRSLWSKRNIEKVAGLTAEGRMQPAGLLEVEAAKADGRWEAAYDRGRDMTVPEDFLKAVATSKRAQATFDQLKRAELFAIGYRLQTARQPATRQRRFDKLLADLERGEAP